MLLLWHGSQRQALLAARGHGTWSSPRMLAEMELGRGGLFFPLGWSCFPLPGLSCFVQCEHEKM